jgi:hypothetical protein
VLIYSYNIAFLAISPFELLILQLVFLLGSEMLKRIDLRWAGKALTMTQLLWLNELNLMGGSGNF